MVLFTLHLSSMLAPFWLRFQFILGPFWLDFNSILAPFGFHLVPLGGPGAGARIVLLIPRFWDPFWGPWPRQKCCEKIHAATAGQALAAKRITCGHLAPAGPTKRKHAATFLAGRGARKWPHDFYLDDKSCGHGCRKFGAARNHTSIDAGKLDLRKSCMHDFWS